ncbi:hypothetical protein CRD60_00915 [Bifidobacterium aemilianum]|uniref:Uncharacterized protein n=1 Tax=Bifidobacterium aemilianum TaxID=2493120 RepID=A0A366KBA5_9BIFI|nr:hypothetical protein [Bifidobacterium aemilianum]RBP98458.1 hypothetical protein CRD60_00915 [Bifidobacterium aemilianum]
MAATKPQDHKQPKDQTKDITAMGVDLTIDPAIFDDLDMTEYLYEIEHSQQEDGQGSGALNIVPFLRKLCGSAYGKAKNVLRDPQSGRIPMERVGEFINEVFGELAPNS